MSENQDNRQLSLTMNFYLLSSILMAICHLTWVHGQYATVRTIACTNVKPSVSCPYHDKSECDNYCQVLKSYVDRIAMGDRKCPYSLDPLFCPDWDPVHCLNFCNTPASYQPYNVPDSNWE